MTAPSLRIRIRDFRAIGITIHGVLPPAHADQWNDILTAEATRIATDIHHRAAQITEETAA